MDIAQLGISVDSRQVKGATADLDNFSRSGARAESATAGATSAIGAMGVAVAAAAVAAAAAAKETIALADAYNKLEARVGMATQSLSMANERMKDIFSIAQRTNAPLAEMGDLITKLSPSIMKMGGSFEQVTATSEAFALTIKNSGAGAQQAASALLQFGQAMDKGLINGDEFTSMAENNGYFLNLLSEELGVTRGELRKMSEEGKLTSDIMANTLIKNIDRLTQDFKNIPIAVSDAAVSVANSFQLMAAESELVNTTSQLTSSTLLLLSKTMDNVTDATSRTATEAEKLEQENKIRFWAEVAGRSVAVVADTFTVFGAVLVSARDVIVSFVNGAIRQFSTLGTTFSAIMDGIKNMDPSAVLAATKNGMAEIANGWKLEAVGLFNTIGKNFESVGQYQRAFDAALNATAGTSKRVEANLKGATAETDKNGKAAKATAAAQKEFEKAFKEAAKASEEFGSAVKRARESALESAIRQADAVEELVKRAEEEAKTHGMNAEALAQYNLAQAEAAVVTARAAGIAEERIQQLEREVEARRELVGLTSSAARRDEAAETKKATEQAAADMGKSVQGTLATAIRAGLESGNPVKGFAKSLYQQTKTAIINAIAEGMATRLTAGIMGGTASGAASANGMSGMMGGDIFSNGSQLLTAGLNKLQGMWNASSVTPAQMTADLAYGGTGDAATVATSQLGASGSWATTASNVLPYIPAIISAFDSFKTGEGWGRTAGMAAGTYVGTAVGASLGGTLGAVAGPLGMLAGAAIGSFIDKKFGGGGEKVGGFASTGAMDRLYTPSQADASLAKVVGGVTDSIGALAKSLGVTAGGFNVGLGFDTDPQGKAGNRVSSRLLDSAGRVIYESINRQVEDAQAGVAVEAQRLALAAIKSSNLPEEFARAFGGVAIAEATDEQVASITAQLQAIQAVKDVFDTVGAAMSQLKGLGYEARESLVALAGGVESLTAGLASYYQNFYTGAERANAATEQLRKQFSDMGMTLPATREAFRALVEAQDLTTEAGRRMYAQLIGLSGAVAEFATRTEEAARKAAEAAAAKAEADRRAFGETVRAAEEARRAYDDLVRDAQRTYESSVREAFSALSAAVNAEKEAVNKSAQSVIDDYQRQISAQEKLAESARKSAGSLQSVIDILSAGVRSIRGGMTVAAARSFISSSIAAGGVTDTEQLKLAVDTIKAIDESQYSTREELDRARGQAAGDMDVLQSLTGKQLTEAMRQVTAAESAASSLKLMIEETVKGRDLQLAALDAMLQQQQAQVNAALGIKDAVMSVKDAITALGGAIRSIPVLPPAPPSVPTAPAVPTAPVVTTPPGVTPPPVVHTGAGAAPSGSKSVYSSINDIYQQVLKREADASGLIFYATQAMGGKSLDQIRAEIANSPEAKGIDGSHRNGLDRVPFDGYRAELHAGERVLTAQQADSSDKMVEDVSSMDTTMKRVYQVLDRVDQMFNDWDARGLPPTRTS